MDERTGEAEKRVRNQRRRIFDEKSEGGVWGRSRMAWDIEDVGERAEEEAYKKTEGLRKGQEGRRGGRKRGTEAWKMGEV